MSEEAPATPAPEAAPAEPSTPTTSAPEAAPASAPEQSAQEPATTPAEGANTYFTNEQLAEMQKMFENNGGYEKAWGRMKDAISRPQAVTQPEAPQAPAQAQTAQTPAQSPEAPQSAPEAPRAGTYSMEELAAQTYFERLANDEKYANIADEIRTGKVLEGLKNFNIAPITDGRVNDADIRKYLDLYSATKPAKPTSSEPTASPSMANDISNITKVTTREEADRIQLEDIRLRAAGQPGHPLAEEAKKFVTNYYKEGLDRKRR